jgi:predicted DNA-binding transcriptional regulator AlpA
MRTVSFQAMFAAADMGGAACDTTPWSPQQVSTGPGHGNKLLTDVQVAAFLNMSVRSVRNYRLRGGGPAYCKIGALVRYRLSDVEAFVASTLRASTSDQGAR